MYKSNVEQNLTATGIATAETTSVIQDNSTSPQIAKPGMGSRILNVLGLRGENFLGSTPKPQEPPTQLPTTEMQPLQSTPETSAANVILEPTIDMQPIQPTNEGPTPVAMQQATVEIPMTDFQPAQSTTENQTPSVEPNQTFGSRLDSSKPFDEYPSSQSPQIDNLSNVSSEQQDPNLTTGIITNETNESATQVAVEPTLNPVSEPPAFPDTGTVANQTTPASDVNPLSERPTFVTEPVPDQVTTLETTTATPEAVTPPEPITDAVALTPASSSIEPAFTTSETPTETAPISSPGPMAIIGGEGSTSAASTKTSPLDSPTTEFSTNPPPPDKPIVVKYV